MKGHRIVYSAAEMAWLKANRLLPIAEYYGGFVTAFGRDDVGVENLKSLRYRKGWKTGRTGYFIKGSEPANKGKPCAPGRGGNHPNARRTQFKPGGPRSGVAVRLYKPIGTERLSKEGYVERKIHDGMPLQSRWRAVHLLNWEAVNGPIPKGVMLKCLDGNKANTDLSNWQALPRAILPRLNGGPHKTSLAYDEASPELRPTILAVAKLAHKARQARRSDEATGDK